MASQVRLRDLKQALQSVRPFDTNLQKPQLEQYPTGADIAAHVIHVAATSFDDICDCTVADLGCGTGMLSIGCALLGASCVLGFDADEDALAIAKENVSNFDLEDTIDFIQCDVASHPMVPHAAVDTVIMNPPFGTRNKGVDVLFIEKAIGMGPRSIYSLHKSSTRSFLLKKCESLGTKAQVLAQLRFDIPKMYKFHKQKTKDIEVDLIRIELPERMWASRNSKPGPAGGVSNEEDGNLAREAGELEEEQNQDGDHLDEVGQSNVEEHSQQSKAEDEKSLGQGNG